MNFKESLYIIYESILLGSAIFASIQIRWLRGKGLALFVPYLWYVFAQETLMHNFHREIFGDEKNDIVYNIYRLITVLFFSIIFYRLPVMKNVRQYIAGLTILYVVAFIITFIAIQSIFEYNSYLSLGRGFVISITGLLFLFSYFQLDNRTEGKFWSPWIWITIGMVVFYPVISISQIFVKYLSDENVFGIRLYNLIPQVMSIFMYSCFSYAFYLCKKRS